VTKSVVVQTQRQFRRDFPGRNAPTRLTTKRLLDNFRETGTVLDNCKGRSGRSRPVRTENLVVTVKQCLEQSPRKSTKRLPQETDISRSSVMHIMHQGLHLFPYKINIYNFRPMQIGMRDLRLGKSPVSKSKNILISWASFFSDEANFHLSGHVNKHNVRFRVYPQLHEHQYHPLSLEKVTVWFALSRNGMIGPYWFEDADGRPVTVKTAIY